MRVVDLDGVVLGEGTYISPDLHMLADDILRRSGNEEILLLEPELLALDMVVSGIKDLGNDLCESPLLHALDIFTF